MEIKIKRNILLNPGPATTSDTVKMSQVVPDICPREREFGDLMKFVSVELTKIVASPQTHTTVLFCGSGTAAVESVISSVVPQGRTILVINNGAYGRRMSQIAQAYNIDTIEFTSSPDAPINLAKLSEVIQNNSNISHLAVVHNETTTGLLNNLDDLGVLTKDNNLELIVDAMSSYAAIPIDMEQQNLDYVCASSNKNIQGMAGASFVISKVTTLQKLEAVTPRNFYLNLFSQYENFVNTYQMRFTPPVQTLYALKQAIIEAKEEGVENRYERYSKSWDALISGLKELKLEFLVEEKHHSKIITSIYLPKGIDFDQMHDFLYKKGYTIYPGKVAKLDTFRVANIGDIDYRDILEFIKLLKLYFKNCA